jgi:peptidoglycan/LPS O-acetylase OafA/YrhL
MRKPQKIIALEGIRGLAALAVVFHHLMLMLCPGMYNARQISLLGHILSDTPLSLPHNGPFAVRVFFVLSGVVLSLAYFRRPDPATLTSAACRRYPRLALPVAASLLFAFTLLSCGCFHNAAAADLMRRPDGDWLRGRYQFDADAGYAVKEAFYSAYFALDPKRTYNSVLWTMGIELFGSMLVYAFLALVGSVRKRWLLHLGGIALLVQWERVYFVDFLCGVALADLYCYVSRRWPDWQLGATPTWALVVLGAVGASLKPTVLRDLGWGHLIVAKDYWPTFAALCFIVAALFSPKLRRWLEARPIAWLGKISFSLYLFHLPIICSLGAWLLIQLWTVYGWGYLSTSAAVVAVCTATSLGMAHVMAMTVERWSIVWPQQLYDAYLRPCAETPSKVSATSDAPVPALAPAATPS